MRLADKKCVPCEGGALPLVGEVLEKYRAELGGEWSVIDGKKILKEFSFSDFKTAMVFVDTIAGIAESEGHHPDISIFYNRVVIELSTHAINGLSKNDFIVAAKIDRISF